VLKPVFFKCLRQAETLKRLLFLYLYSGTACVSLHLKQQGFGVITFEIQLGKHFDLTNTFIHKVIKGWITSGCTAGLMIATQCSSWSRARHGPIGSAWGPIRSNDPVIGSPHLSVADAAKIQLGNLQMRNTADIIACCIRHTVPCILGNPASSFILKAPL